MSMDWKEHDRQSEAPQGEKSKISPALIAWIVVAVLAVVFILQNTRQLQGDVPLLGRRRCRSGS